ncbi:MAG: hypothetical protein HY327_08975, partial [Chloroflexi bacterium]|nr:hypothetical protein [Chloroflexota bacterium]
LDVSYRAFLRGWDARYLREVGTPAEIPVSFSAYRRQQHRWARGSLECARKLLPRVWRARISTTRKIQATLHLTGYSIHLWMVALTLLYPVLISLPASIELRTLFGIAFIFNITTFAPLLLAIVAQKELKRDWVRRLPAILFLTILGGGMMLNTARAALAIVLRHENIFERTPKFGIARREQEWTHREYLPALDPIVYAEIVLGAFLLWSTALAADAGSWVIVIYSLMFSTGLFFTSGVTIAQTLAVQWRRSRAPVLEPLVDA